MSKDYNVKITLFEGVLNNDYILLNQLTGKVTLVYYTFATCWSNHEHKRQFWSIEDACEWYHKQFPDRVILQGAWWRTEEGETTDPEYQHLKELMNDDWSTAIENMTEVEKADSISEWETMTIYCEIY